MPNTLAHFGIQGVASRSLIRGADPKWIFLGCIIPDLPWILVHGLNAVAPGLDPYNLRLYAVAQSSLVVSLLICGALALLSRKPKLILGILAFNSLAHLLLDAVETKWGNGVHLFAPFSWELVNFGLFWPESALILTLTFFGLGYLIWVWRGSVNRPAGIAFRPWRRSFFAVLLLVAYFSAPVLLLDGPAQRDNHSVTTLRQREQRTGKDVAFDRELYFARGEAEVLRTWAGEDLVVTGKRLGHSGRVSVKGTFVEPATLRIHQLREHRLWERKAASMLGLALLAALWLTSLLRAAIRALGNSRRSRYH